MMLRNLGSDADTCYDSNVTSASSFRKQVLNMAEGLLVLAGLVAFEFVAARFAKSTRDGEDWVVQEEGPHLLVHA